MGFNKEAFSRRRTSHRVVVLRGKGVLSTPYLSGCRRCSKNNGHMGRLHYLANVIALNSHSILTLHMERLLHAKGAIDQSAVSIIQSHHHPKTKKETRER
ncbi:hypothetical protein EJ110_NYTH12755 [Nymphaea thermarum]|nr:hypothetical protein EJ110_NYTH12755 [Nymphaea thermarum]